MDIQIQTKNHEIICSIYVQRCYKIYKKVLDFGSDRRKYDIPLCIYCNLTRNIFVTVVTHKNGVSMETVGYAKLYITQIYAEVDEKIIAGDMDSVETRFYEKMN